jgi:hypothetical protein
MNTNLRTDRLSNFLHAVLAIPFGMAALLFATRILVLVA